MRILYRVIAAMLALAPITQAAAGDVVLHVGDFQAGDFLSVRKDDGSSWMGGVEYRFADQYRGLRPTLGVLATDDSAAYAYGGAYWDVPLGNSAFIFSPGLAVGAYHKGAGKDLGSVLEFRSALELTYRFSGGDRLGVQMSHISNAGLGDSNSGTETLQAVYGVAF